MNFMICGISYAVFKGSTWLPKSITEPSFESYDIEVCFNNEKRNSSRDEDTAWTTAACLSYWDEKDLKKKIGDAGF